MTSSMFRAALFLALLPAGLALSGCHSTPTTPNTPAASSPSPDATSPAASPDAATPSATSTAAPTLEQEPGAGFTWLYALVNNTKTSLDMTMYELVDTTLSGDLVAACKRGVKVRVILDQNLEKTYNTPAYNQLAAAGSNCSVAWANPQFQATHQKSMILDGKTAVVMTFNTTTRYYTTSRDLALIDTDAADIAGIEATFVKDFKSTTDLSFAPPKGDNLIWSPTTAEPDLLALINNAKATLLIENEELGSPEIVSAMGAACKRGVKLSLAMTDTSVNYHSNYATLQAAGCGVHIGANNATTLYIHEKAIIADLGTPTAIGYAGSINFSDASMTQNRELGLYLHDATLLGKIGATITSDYNSFPSFSASAAAPASLPARP